MFGPQSSLLPLLYLQSAVLAAAPPSLDCTYNSWDILSCTWDGPNPSTATPCYVQAIVTTRSDRMGFCALPLGVTPQKCDLQLNNRKKHIAALTYGDIVNITVLCEEKSKVSNVTVSLINIKPYDNLRLDPPRIEDIQETTDGLWNISWSSHSNIYITGSTEFEVNYKPSRDSWQAAKTIPDKHNEKSIPLRNLLPDTLYEARVRVIVPEDGSRWSDWSQVKMWRTHARADMTSGSSLITQVVAPCAAVVVFLILVTLIIRSQDRFKKMIWVSIPNPSSFFETLLITHKGNFQNWLSSPFSLSSFSLDSTPQDISPVNISWKKEELLPKCTPPSFQENLIDNSGHSFSSFSNQGYFFFQFPTIKEEGGSTPTYFAYDGMEQIGFPVAQQTVPFPSPPPGDELPLFHADYLSLPPSDGINNRSFMTDPRLQIILSPPPPQEDRDDQSHDKIQSQDSLLPSEEEVSGNENEEEHESLKEQPGGGTIPVKEETDQVPSPGGDGAGGYLSLRELYHQHICHWV